MNLDRLTVADTATLRDAMITIDGNALGIVFVTDADGVLRGVLTDGDVRRLVLVATSLDVAVGTVMNRQFVSLPSSVSSPEVLSKLTSKVRVLPLVDDAGRPVDYATLSRHSRIPMAEPNLQGRELEYVTECISSNWISSQGRFVRQFEEAFASYVGVEHAVSTTSGTTALHLTLLAHGIGPGDEVVVPNLTFAATANSVIHAGATPVLVDVLPTTWNLDPAEVRSALTERTRAIMPVHLYGLPADMDAMRTLAGEAELVLIEDAAEGLGARWRGEPVGCLGDAGAFSFFGNKLMTTGEGGMALFRDGGAAARARQLRDHGMDTKRRYWHLEVGYNYRMTNVQAAIGLAQLERIDYLVGEKKRIAAEYRTSLAEVEHFRLPHDGPPEENIHWMFSVTLEAGAALDARTMVARLNDLGIDARPFFHPLHQMPPYVEYGTRGSYPVSTQLAESGISLPSSPSLDSDRITYIAEVLQRLLSPLASGNLGK